MLQGKGHLSDRSLLLDWARVFEHPAAVCEAPGPRPVWMLTLVTLSPGHHQLWVDLVIEPEAPGVLWSLHSLGTTCWPFVRALVRSRTRPQPLPREPGTRPHVAQQQKHSVCVQMLCSGRTVTRHPEGPPSLPSQDNEDGSTGRGHTRHASTLARFKSRPMPAKEAAEPWLPRGLWGVIERG